MSHRILHYPFLTQYERDNETGLDYAQARYYLNTQGRFISPDPLLASGRITQPQSWNRYSYCINNPLKFIDPSGLSHWTEDGRFVGDKNHEYNKDLNAYWNKKYQIWDFVGNHSPVTVTWSETIRTANQLAAFAIRVVTNVQDASRRRTQEINDRRIISLYNYFKRPETPLTLLAPAAAPGSGEFGEGESLESTVLEESGVAPEISATVEEAELGNKLEFLLGNATGSEENIQRSTTMLRQLESVGLPDSAETRALLQSNLNAVLNDASSIARTQANGRVVRDSLILGPRGVLKMESIWERNKLITVWLFGGH